MEWDSEQVVSTEYYSGVWMPVWHEFYKTDARSCSGRCTGKIEKGSKQY